jgi:chemotaxis response regulator CheB
MSRKTKPRKRRAIPLPHAKGAPRTESDAPVDDAVEPAKESEEQVSRPARAESGANAESAEGAQTENELVAVVGVGASAGGLEAFKRLLARLPSDTGMAFVLVTHLDPKHESILPELLARATRMPVSEVEDGTPVAPDHIYVMPRNTSMAIEGGELRLRLREKGRGQHHPKITNAFLLQRRVAISCHLYLARRASANRMYALGWLNDRRRHRVYAHFQSPCITSIA